jgi:hypothetical protein
VHRHGSTPRPERHPIKVSRDTSQIVDDDWKRHVASVPPPLDGAVQKPRDFGTRERESHKTHDLARQPLAADERPQLKSARAEEVSARVVLDV